MQYPLEEKIGPPELLVGRQDEFARLNQWIERIPRKLSKSRVILARRKSGKTSLIQRIFNQLWSQNGQVIPFYLDIADENIWYPDFTIKYFSTFASQYISFLERDEELVRLPLSLEQIRAYGVEKGIKALVQDVDAILYNHETGHNDLVWDTAKSAPHRYASAYDQRFLVILDEFQNIAFHVYRDEACTTSPMETMPGSFHSLSESKVAPMLVTGSYIGILQRIMDEYLEAGRLSITRFQPYLEPEEGLEAVYRYAEVYQEPITNQTAQQINELCLSDPFFISCVILSEFKERDLTTAQGVINTVDFEISNRESELSTTWAEYIRLTFERINGENTKSMMLYLNKHDERFWRPRELKEKLNLELSEKEIYDRLVMLSESDVILRGTSDIQFSGLKDGTLNLVLRNRFEEEIEGVEPDFKTEFQEQLAQLQSDKNKLRGRNNYLEGMMAERLLAIELQSKKHLRLSRYFTGSIANNQEDSELNIVDVQERVLFQRKDNKSEEIDIVAKTDDGKILMIEVRKRQEKTGLNVVTDLWDNAAAYGEQFGVLVLPSFLSLGGFTKEAEAFCAEHGIGISEGMDYFA